MENLGMAHRGAANGGDLQANIKCWLASFILGRYTRVRRTKNDGRGCATPKAAEEQQHVARPDWIFPAQASVRASEENAVLSRSRGWQNQAHRPLHRIKPDYPQMVIHEHPSAWSTAIAHAPPI
jgi:hypothetical protein